MKLILSVVCLLILGIHVVSAQSGSCGFPSVQFVKTSAGDYKALAVSGSEAGFDCIVAKYDPNFKKERFPSAGAALNAWYIYLGEELGVVLAPLPAPTSWQN